LVVSGSWFVVAHEPRAISQEPKERKVAIKTYGTMAVDWERRIDFDRLRRERLARIKGLRAKS
jgi:hypothetical protein